MHLYVCRYVYLYVCRDVYMYVCACVQVFIYTLFSFFCQSYSEYAAAEVRMCTYAGMYVCHFQYWRDLSSALKYFFFVKAASSLIQCWRERGHAGLSL